MLGARSGRHAMLIPGTVALILLGAAHAAAQANSGGKMVILKDPTPRDPDPELLYKPRSPDQDVPDRAARLAAYNQQRLTLVRRAAGQLASLSAVLNTAVERSLSPGTPASQLVPAIQVAGTIETLASQVHNALAPAAFSGSHGDQKRDLDAPPLRSEPTQLQSAAKLLLQSAQNLQAEADRSRADTLSVSLIQQSADLHTLAASLRLGMLAVIHQGH